SIQIVATQNPTAFSATGLPPGVSIDAATGLITGLPAEPGAYPVKLTATNANGSGEGSLMILVDMAPLAISGFLPTTSVPGDTVTIVGSGFTGARTVIFYGRQGMIREAAFTVASDTE